MVRRKIFVAGAKAGQEQGASFFALCLSLFVLLPSLPTSTLILVPVRFSREAFLAPVVVHFPRVDHFLVHSIPSWFLTTVDGMGHEIQMVWPAAEGAIFAPRSLCSGGEMRIECFTRGFAHDDEYLRWLASVSVL